MDTAMAGKLLRTIDEHELYAKYAAHAGKDINGVPLEDRELLSAELKGNTLTLESTEGDTVVNVVPTPDAGNKVLKSTGAGQYTWELAAEYPGDGELKLKLGTDTPIASGFNANSPEDVVVTIPGATEENFGLMSPTDKTKLDNVATGATRVEFLDSTKNGQIAINGVDRTVYTHPTPMQSNAPLNLYKFKADKMGHIQEVYKVKKDDIVALGIPAQDTTYESLPEAEAGTDVSLVITGEKYVWNRKYERPTNGIPSTDMTVAVQTSLGKADTAYQKPATGIPSSDMSDSVRAALDKADSAIQGVGEQDGGLYPVDENGIARIPAGTRVNDAALSMVLGTSAARQIFTANAVEDTSFTIPIARMSTASQEPVYTEGLVGQAMYEKVDGIAPGAEVNAINSISANNVQIVPDANRNVNIDLGTWTYGTYTVPTVATP